MIHKLTVGHFDLEALKQGRLVLKRALDMAVVKRLLRELAHSGENGEALLEGYAIEFKDGYLVCPWHMAQKVTTTEEFVRRLQRETGCVIFDRTRREVLTVEQMAAW